jgi:hypothetical protein
MPKSPDPSSMLEQTGLRSQPDRERFVNTAARLAGEVYDFHERWALESGTPLEVIIKRTPMLDEEVRELKEEVERPISEFDEAKMAEEAADVLFCRSWPHGATWHRWAERYECGDGEKHRQDPGVSLQAPRIRESDAPRPERFPAD